ncbi:uncharacterized protein LOC115679603 isoform X2 [Syzygium oleosum]|nr:uncharacterized protein LOC115679603 isoform X2 [Syzygium oleosum]XP_056162527.1 uncharacterized protein LOC115679603 isoform X2 [Syzygium oleosum]
MGSACCVASREQTVPCRAANETLHRNIIYSPSWSFRWENRRRVAGEIDNPPYELNHGNSDCAPTEIKEPISSRRGHISDGRSPLGIMGAPISQQSPAHDVVGADSATSISDISQANNDSAELKNAAESPESVTPKISFSTTIPPSFSMPIADPLSSHTPAIPPNSTPSRRAVGHQLLRQISDSRILGMKSPCRNSVSEGRPSFVLSPCSNEFTAGSQSGFSDGWSMRTFSELVASSQKERWSFDSEQFSSGCGKISGCSSRFSSSPSIDLQTCGACTKLLTERSSFRITSNEVAVVAVLVCGHVYHAECLDIMTQETDRYDPNCPICTMGEKQVLKMSKKAELKSRSYKIFKKRVGDGDSKIFDKGKLMAQERKIPRLEMSSSSGSSFTKPFLRRHFSLGSKWGRSLSENDSARKRGFWSRYRRD